MIRIAALVAVGLTLAGCAAPANSPTPEPTPMPSAQAAGLPAECATVELVSPDGEVVNLDGEWAAEVGLVSQTESVLLNQRGGCLYGVVSGEDPDGTRAVTNVTGQIRQDFTVDVQLAIVFQESRFRSGEYSTMVMTIEWDDAGELRLREVRESGEVAGRCIQSQLECGPPAVWYRVTPP